MNKGTEDEGPRGEGGLMVSFRGKLRADKVPTDICMPEMPLGEKHIHGLRPSCFYLKSSPEGVSAFVPPGLPSSLSARCCANLLATKPIQL